MFHIVFQPGDVEVLTTAMDMDEGLDGEIILISDDYSLGPISNLSSEEGMAMRKAWWHQISQTRPEEEKRHAGLIHNDRASLQPILNRMHEEEFDQIWIWVASNVQDLSGYYWLISLLKEFAGRIYVVSLNNLPFINEKGTVFYPSYLSEIPPREFLKAKRLARPVTLAEFETDPDEWTKLGQENKNIRVLDSGKKLVQHPDEYFDLSLKKFLTADFQKSSRIIHHFLSKSPVKTGEVFLRWRLEQLDNSGEIERQGEMLKISQNDKGDTELSL
jgi:hypothetical protein